jgi:large subunit ribosomal protein L13
MKKCTVFAKNEEITRKWYVVDAEGVVLGRMASEIAKILRGKHKAIYTPSVDTGDNVIVINAEKVRLTGNKLSDKRYYRHTGHPGGIKETSPEKILGSKFPERVIELAVKRMISRNTLGRDMMRKLHIYGGSTHPHAAQKPEIMDIASKNPKNKR